MNNLSYFFLLLVLFEIGIPFVSRSKALLKILLKRTVEAMQDIAYLRKKCSQELRAARN
jgi:hypothetical protein